MIRFILILITGRIAGIIMPVHPKIQSAISVKKDSTEVVKANI
jgi:hypothetical protein